MRQDLRETSDISSVLEGYSVLRSLSVSSYSYLCRENATDRLISVRFATQANQDELIRATKALIDLEDFESSPGVLFAKHLPMKGNLPFTFTLATSFFLGRTLEEWKPEITAKERDSILRATHDSLRYLHKNFHYAHGDLSPRNILAKRSGQDSKSGWKIQFIDWEYCVPLKNQNLSHHDHFEGTFGYAPLSPMDSIEKDIASLHAVERFFLSNK